MANSESRPSFRLPWSSDRSHEDPNGSVAVEAAPESAAGEAEPGAPTWPDSDFGTRLGTTPPTPRPADAIATAGETGTEESDMIDQASPTAPVEHAAPPAPRKSTQLMVDLATAIRATTEAARDHALAAVETDATDVAAAIRTAATEGAGALRRQSDEDLAAIKEWSKAEIARIREETESRIGARKATLETELAAHASAVEHRIGEVDEAVARYRADMDAYVESLKREDDPARLATMAEAMPEPPALDAWRDISNLDLAAFAPPAVEAVEAEAIEAPDAETPTGALDAEAVEAPEAVAADVVESVDAETVATPEAVASDAAETAESVEAETVATPEAVAADAAETAESAVDVESPLDVEPADTASTQTATKERANPWGVVESPWTAGAAARAARAAESRDEAGDEHDVPRWATGETPDGFPAGAEGGEPVDRGAIMAALEAAAEAVVAAESAAESANQAEAAADVAETAAELLSGRASEDESAEAHAMLNARVDAGGFETQSFTDRLASLLSSHADSSDDAEPRTTQVVVTGLVSVASIASFKRHLGRLAGVLTVGVASGPSGEFVFNVTHRPDVSFKDVIPSMPGFAARVTGTGDGVVSVTARDPEAEG